MIQTLHDSSWPSWPAIPGRPWHLISAHDSNFAGGIGGALRLLLEVFLKPESESPGKSAKGPWEIPPEGGNLQSQLSE